jgi:hypothetical protein
VPLQPKLDRRGIVVACVATSRRPPLNRRARLLPREVGREPDLVEKLVVRSPLGAVAVRPCFRPRLVGIIRRIRAACLVGINQGVHEPEVTEGAKPRRGGPVVHVAEDEEGAALA